MDLFTTKTPEQKEARRLQREAERAAAQVRRDAERAAEAERQAEWNRQQAELKRIEKEARKRRFEAFPEFIVREYREVTVKAATENDAIRIAEIAFEHGQYGEGRSYSINHDWLNRATEGNTIDKIRRVAIKVARFLD